MNTKRYPIIPNHSPVTAKCIELLKTTDQMTLTDAEIAAAVGVGCATGEKGYHSLATAIRYVRNNFSKVWARQRGAKAISRVIGSAGNDAAEMGRASMYRKAKKTAQIIAIVAHDEMTPDERLRNSVLGAQVGTILLMADSKMTKAMTIRSTAAPVSYESMLKLFEKKQ